MLQLSTGGRLHVDAEFVEVNCIVGTNFWKQFKNSVTQHHLSFDLNLLTCFIWIFSINWWAARRLHQNSNWTKFMLWQNFNNEKIARHNATYNLQIVASGSPELSRKHQLLMALNKTICFLARASSLTVLPRFCKISGLNTQFHWCSSRNTSRRSPCFHSQTKLAWVTQRPSSSTFVIQPFLLLAWRSVLARCPLCLDSFSSAKCAHTSKGRTSVLWNWPHRNDRHGSLLWDRCQSASVPSHFGKWKCLFWMPLRVSGANVDGSSPTNPAVAVAETARKFLLLTRRGHLFWSDWSASTSSLASPRDYLPSGKSWFGLNIVRHTATIRLDWSSKWWPLCFEPCHFPSSLAGKLGPVQAKSEIITWRNFRPCFPFSVCICFRWRDGERSNFIVL